MRELRVPVWVAVIVYFVCGAVGWALIAYLYHRLPVAWQWLAVLVAVLIDLIRTTGAVGVKRIITEPATLAGPIQPWASVDVQAPPLADAGIGDGIHLVTGIWNPALVRPLLDDPEEDNE